MKRIKRLISCFLIFTVFMTTQSMAFAISENEKTISHTEDVVNITEVTLSNTEEGRVVLRGVDYSNGDACFFIIEDEQIISSSYVDRDEMTTTYVDYKAKIINQDSYEDDLANVTYTMPNIQPVATSGYTSAGKVGYLLYRTTQGETFKYGPSYLNIEYLKETFNTRYDVNGKYKDKAALAARIASLMALSAGIAVPLAVQILNELGILEAATNFIIGTKYVKATQTVMTWRAKGGTSSQKIEGSKYVFKMDGSSIHTDYTGNYYGPNSISNKNKALAIKLAKKYLPGYSKYEIYKWG